jgi:Zn-dependent protease
MLTGQWWVHRLVEQGEITLLIAWTFWVIFSICMHELAHGWAALWQGDDTPRQMGHMNMNPLVHMGGWSLLAFALIGIAWGAMPVNPANFRDRRWGRLYVAAAGPAMNLAIAFVMLLVTAVWVRHSTGRFDFDDDVTVVLFTGIWLNLLLMLLNLLPIAPLDGSRILGAFSWRLEQFFNTPQAQMFGLFALIVLIVSGIVGMVFGAVQVLSLMAVELLVLLLP